MPWTQTAIEKRMVNTMDLYGSALYRLEECFTTSAKAINNNIPLIMWAYIDGGYIYILYIIYNILFGSVIQAMNKKNKPLCNYN